MSCTHICFDDTALDSLFNVFLNRISRNYTEVEREVFDSLFVNVTLI